VHGVGDGPTSRVDSRPSLRRRSGRHQRHMMAFSEGTTVDQTAKRVHDGSDGSIGGQGSRGFAGRMRLRRLHADTSQSPRRCAVLWLGS
jgi:hypothetical protein